MNNLQDLKIWQYAFKLAKDVYLLAKKFPPEEKYGMGSQVKRCASAIPANIAEGAGRNSNKEFVQFLSIANGSAYELETFILLAYEVEYISEESKNDIIERNKLIIRMNMKLQESLKNTFK